MPQYVARRILLVAAVVAPMLLITMNVAFGQKGPIIIQRPNKPQVVVLPQGNGGAMILEGGRPVGTIQPNGGGVILNQPNPTPPNIPITQQIMVWYCKSCGKELSRGGPRPAFDSCPFCHVSFRTGSNDPVPKAAVVEQPALKQEVRPVEPVDDSWFGNPWIIAALVAVVVLGIGAVACIILVVVYKSSAPKPRKTVRRRQRLDDDFER